MKTIRLEISKIKDYVETFWNGCHFILIFEDNEVYLDNGCYGTFFKIGNRDKIKLYEKIKKEGKIKLELTPEEKIELLKIPPDCRRCHSHVHVIKEEG